MENIVDYGDNVSIKDYFTIFVVASTKLYKCLQELIKELKSFNADNLFLGEVMKKGGYFFNYVYTVAVLCLLSKIILHLSELPITHESKDLAEECDMTEVIKVENLMSFFINITIRICKLKRTLIQVQVSCCLKNLHVQRPCIHQSI